MKIKTHVIICRCGKPVYCKYGERPEGKHDNCTFSFNHKNEIVFDDNYQL